MFISDVNDEDLEISIKVVIVGNGAVGKSSLIQRYCRGTFTKGYKKTIGVDFLEKHLRISGEDVRLMLWDTAGQEEFDAITKAYYRGAQACVVAFSTIDRSSFEAVRKWKAKVEEECGGVGMGNLPMVLVQNKIDLMHQSSVSSEEVERLAKEFRMRVYRTSVKEDINVGNVFQHLAENYVHQVRLEHDLMRFEIGGPRSLCVQIGGGGRPGRSQSSSPNEADRSCNGSTSSTSSTSSSSRLSALGSVGSSGYFSLTDFGPTANLRSSRSISTTSTGSHVTPQDYLNNPMFDSLNTHHRLFPNSDRAITLKPLQNFMTKKRKKSSSSNLHSRKFGISSTVHLNNQLNHHQLQSLPPPGYSKGGLSACKMI